MDYGWLFSETAQLLTAATTVGRLPGRCFLSDFPSPHRMQKLLPWNFPAPLSWEIDSRELEPQGPLIFDIKSVSNLGLRIHGRRHPTQPVGRMVYQKCLSQAPDSSCLGNVSFFFQLLFFPFGGISFLDQFTLLTLMLSCSANSLNDNRCDVSL